MTGKSTPPQDVLAVNPGAAVSRPPQPSGVAPCVPASSTAGPQQEPHPDGAPGSFDLDWTSAGNDYDLALSWRARASSMCELINSAYERYSATNDERSRQVLEEYWRWFRGTRSDAEIPQEHCVIFSLGVIAPLAVTGDRRFNGTMELPDRPELFRFLERGEDGKRLRLGDVADIRSLVKPLTEESHAEFLRLARWVRWLYGFLHGDPRPLPLELTAMILFQWRYSGGNRRVPWLKASEGDHTLLDELLSNKNGATAVLLVEMGLSRCEKSETEVAKVGEIVTRAVPSDIVSFKSARYKTWERIVKALPTGAEAAAARGEATPDR